MYVDYMLIAMDIQEKAEIRKKVEYNCMVKFRYPEKSKLNS